MIEIKKYITELDEGLSAVYEDIAKMNYKPTGEAPQIIFKRVIESLLQQSPAPKEP